MRSASLGILSLVDSVTGTSYGPAIDSSQWMQASAQISFSGTPVGTFFLQASNDVAPYKSYANSTSGFGVGVPSVWSLIPGASAACSGGVAELITLDQCAYKFVRAGWTYTSGGAGSGFVANAFYISNN